MKNQNVHNNENLGLLVFSVAYVGTRNATANQNTDQHAHFEWHPVSYHAVGAEESTNLDRGKKCTRFSGKATASGLRHAFYTNMDAIFNVTYIRGRRERGRPISGIEQASQQR